MIIVPGEFPISSKFNSNKQEPNADKETIEQTSIILIDSRTNYTIRPSVNDNDFRQNINENDEKQMGRMNSTKYLNPIIKNDSCFNISNFNDNENISDCFSASFHFSSKCSNLNFNFIKLIRGFF